VTWVQDVAHADWSPRSSYAAVVHNDTLWILGGYGPGFTGAFLRDVWRSADGTHWSQATEAASWTARRYHAAVSFGGRIWILGGFSADGQRNDVWATSDGVVWQEVLAHAPWSPRAGLAAVVHDGRMWVLGGDEDSEGAVVTRNDVWSTADGVTWVQATGAAPWEPRRTHTAVAYRGRIWIMGGRSSGRTDRFFNDVWSSADGETWVRSTAAAPWRPRRGHTSVAFDGALWLIGGADAGLLGDVWSFRLPVE
jgi:N-acetylneuraminic acid mutarotase